MKQMKSLRLLVRLQAHLVAQFGPAFSLETGLGSTSSPTRSLLWPQVLQKLSSKRPRQRILSRETHCSGAETDSKTSLHPLAPEPPLPQTSSLTQPPHRTKSKSEGITLCTTPEHSQIIAFTSGAIHLTNMHAYNFTYTQWCTLIFTLSLLVIHFSRFCFQHYDAVAFAGHEINCFGGQGVLLNE